MKSFQMINKYSALIFTGIHHYCKTNTLYTCIHEFTLHYIFFILELFPYFL